jgi:hypothetical protein
MPTAIARCNRNGRNCTIDNEFSAGALKRTQPPARALHNRASCPVNLLTEIIVAAITATRNRKVRKPAVGRPLQQFFSSVPKGVLKLNQRAES